MKDSLSGEQIVQSRQGCSTENQRKSTPVANLMLFFFQGEAKTVLVVPSFSPRWY